MRQIVAPGKNSYWYALGAYLLCAKRIALQQESPSVGTEFA